MKEYKVINIEVSWIDTEEKLNKYAKEGWKLICSYARGNRWLILERDKEICKRCGK